jgi:predicted  nucleic acid-binding Zn-ribbon protein
MFRKVSISLVTAVLIAGGISAVPASAAAKISNGVACTKVNATTTVSGYKYKCAKNALVKNSKLTWLSAECLTAITQYQTAVKAQADLTNVADQTAALDTEYATATAALASTSAALDKARAQVTQFQATMNASTVAADKQKLAGAISKLANAVLVLSGAKTKLATQVKDLEAKKALLVSAPGQLKTSADDAKASSALLCAKGF